MKAKSKIFIFLLTLSLMFILGNTTIHAQDLPNRSLKYLEKSQDVIDVQTALKQLSYNLVADGSYGPATKAAVLSFQKKYPSLVNDGIYGPKTRAVMIAALKGTDNTEDKDDTVDSPSNTNLPNRSLKFLEKSQDVKNVQTALKQLGYNVSVDGSYGPGTRAAVLDFQKRYSSLTNDGIYGPKTRAVMIATLKGDPIKDSPIKDIPIEGKVAYLTFDDGPSKTVTPQILNILKDYNIKATFFILGTMAESNPSIVDRIKSEGHSIGNHTYSHNYSYVYASMNNFFGEVNKTESIFKNILGSNFKTRLMRFPGGSFESYKQSYKKEAINRGYKVYDWNSLNGDSEAKVVSVSKQISRIKETVRGQKELIVLMHDSSGKDNTVTALPQIIEYLKSQGYSFRVLSE